MSLIRRDTPSSLAGRLVAAGAQQPVADGCDPHRTEVVAGIATSVIFTGW